MSVPTFIEEDGETETSYFNCPRKFVPLSISEFLRQLNYYKEFPGAKMPGYENVSPRFLQAVQVYNWHLSEALKEKRNG